MRLKINSVIFDMDGVITDTMPTHYAVWRDMFLAQGIKVSKEDIYKREGQRGIESVREIFAEYGKEFSESLALDLLKRKEEQFKKVFKRRFITGSRSYLKFLHLSGFNLALVTGTSRHEAQKLLPPELFALFKVSVCGCEVKRGKPHPEPYEQAIEKLGIQTSQAVVFENAPFGIASAKAAGLRCFALETSLPRAFLKEADAVFSSFKEIKSGVSFVHGK